MFAGLVYASYWIYSSSVTVTVSEYTLELSPSSQNLVKNHYANFTATLKLNENPVGDGYLIKLFYDNGTYTGVSNSTISGSCILRYNMTTAGTYSFKAGYEVP